MNFLMFLDAFSHLYKRVCPSVHPSVCDAFVKIAENGIMQDGDASYAVYTALFLSYPGFFFRQVPYSGVQLFSVFFKGHNTGISLVAESTVFKQRF